MQNTKNSDSLITQFNIIPFETPHNGAVAIASVTFYDMFKVNGITILEGSSGELYVKMPQKRTLQGTYIDVTHPLNAETRMKINEALLSAFSSGELKKEFPTAEKPAVTAQYSVKNKAEEYGNTLGRLDIVVKDMVIHNCKIINSKDDKLCRLGYIERINRYYDDIKRLGSYVYTIPVVRGCKFFFVNRRVFNYRLTASQMRMYLYCCKCAESHSQRFWNSYNDISQELNLKRSAVIKTISELISLGLIKRYKVKKSDGSYSDNHYRVITLGAGGRKNRHKKRRSRFAPSFSLTRNCVKIFYSYILNHKSKNVNTVRINFFDLRGSPKIFSSLYSTHFYSNRVKKKIRLYLKYRCNLRLCVFSKITAFKANAQIILISNHTRHGTENNTPYMNLRGIEIAFFLLLEKSSEKWWGKADKLSTLLFIIILSSENFEHPFNFIFFGF